MSVRSCKVCVTVSAIACVLCQSVSPSTTLFVDTIGVGHADDVAFVFGVPFNNDPFWSELLASNWTDVDRRVSDHVMNMWTNFAKQG